jgi:hypothetical protein
LELDTGPSAPSRTRDITPCRSHPVWSMPILNLPLNCRKNAAGRYANIFTIMKTITISIENETWIVWIG